MVKALSERYVADEFTLNCKGLCRSGNVDYKGFNEQLQLAIGDRRYKVHFLGRMGNYASLKFAGITYHLFFDSDTDSWIPEKESKHYRGIE